MRTPEDVKVLSKAALDQLQAESCVTCPPGVQLMLAETAVKLVIKSEDAARPFLTILELPTVLIAAAFDYDKLLLIVYRRPETMVVSDA